MKKYLAAACGAALIIATVGYSVAQPNPGADRKAGESSSQSANPNPDKGTSNQPNKNVGKKANPKTTPPGTDSEAGESSTQSAKPKPR